MQSHNSIFGRRLGNSGYRCEVAWTLLNGSVTASINHFGIYTLMVFAPTDLERTDRLRIQNVKLSPRVFFAPDRNRLTVVYQLKAPNAMQAFVTMDIFDLRGRRVRRLLEDAPHSTSVLTLHSGMD